MTGLSTLGKRSAPSAATIAANYETQHDHLHLLLGQCDLDTIKDDANEMSEIAVNLKQAFKKYQLTSYEFVDNKLKLGGTAEAEELRRNRDLLRHEVKERLTFINQFLKEIDQDEISTISSSMVSATQPSPDRELDVMLDTIPRVNSTDAVNNFLATATTAAPDDPQSLLQAVASPASALATTAKGTPSFPIHSSHSQHNPDLSNQPSTSHQVEDDYGIRSQSIYPAPASQISAVATTASSAYNFLTLPSHTQHSSSIFTQASNSQQVNNNCYTMPMQLNSSSAPYVRSVATIANNIPNFPTLSSHTQHHPNLANTITQEQAVSSIVPQFANLSTASRYAPPVTVGGNLNFPSQRLPLRPFNGNSLSHSGYGCSTTQQDTPIFSSTVGANNFGPSQMYSVPSELYQPPPPQHVDPATFYLVRQSLLQPSDKPYDGDPTLYQSWIDTIRTKIKGLTLDYFDLISILEANATGRPLAMIQGVLRKASKNPEEAFRSLETSLRRKFGSDDRVSAAIEAQINDFPIIKSVHQIDRLESLVNLCEQIELNLPHCPELTSFNLTKGIRSIWLKLPDPFQNAWRNVNHNLNRESTYPLFSVFVSFLRNKVEEYSEPGYHKIFIGSDNFARPKKEIKTYRTEVSDHQTGIKCVLHPMGAHELVECRPFTKMTFSDKRKVLSEHGLCFLCTGKHIQANCDQSPKCDKCKKTHATVLHRDLPSNFKKSFEKFDRFDNKTMPRQPPVPDASSLCIIVCGSKNKSLSCSKTLLVEVTNPAVSSRTLRCYAILDEQSSSSFADPKVAEFFSVTQPLVDYSLTTLNGSRSKTQGILIDGLKIKGIGEKKGFTLPKILTNDSIPDCKEEIATPDMVASHKHIAHLSKKFNQFEESAEVLLLIGRDCGEAMRTKCYGAKTPFAHHTSLGWALVGTVCTDKNWKQSNRVLRTHVHYHEHVSAEVCFPVSAKTSKLSGVGDSFMEQSDDELEGLSKEDQRFIDIVSNGITTNDSGNITMPLPFKTDKPVLPNNSQAVFNRTSNCLQRLKRDPEKLTRCLDVMNKYIQAGDVEIVPTTDIVVKDPNKTWYIPVFPVTHKKKNKVRLVFDSSASYCGTSLNSVLLSGPDLNNKLRGVLLRFRCGPIAVSADIESMFHRFHLPPDHRDFTRFYWFRDNDPKQDLVAFRAKVHVFGNTCSPGLANHGLRYAVESYLPCPSQDVKSFVHHHFYVDDGLIAVDSPAKAIATLTETRKVMEHYNIRLHKITSNSSDVLAAFPSSEINQDQTEIDFNDLIQNTLGVAWDTCKDEFVIKTEIPKKPFTKRGILSTINSIFDPLGFASPLVLAGKLIQRMVIPSKVYPNPSVSSLGWDDILPEEYRQVWDDWKESLSGTSGLSTPRSYSPAEFGRPTKSEIHGFSDASKDATGHVLYMKSFNEEGEIHISFIAASSKVAPRAAISIPRLELCAAMDLAIATREVVKQLGMRSEDVTLYSDSQVVLGYLNNTQRRFSMYVTRRTNLTLKCFPAEIWKFVRTDENPADIASRPHDITMLKKSCWFRGPTFLWNDEDPSSGFKLLDCEELPEIEQNCVTLLTSLTHEVKGLSKISRDVSCWNKALKFARVLITFAMNFIDRRLQKLGYQLAPRMKITEESTLFLFMRSVQMEAFPEVFESCTARYPLNNNHPLANLSPFLDDWGVLRVGGRLRNSGLYFNQKFPILLPSVHSITPVIVRYFHQKCKHQGRSITLASVREAGFFIQHGSAVIKRVINQCIICKKLRGSFIEQKMSDLPSDRLEQTPPFTNTGFDVMGPFIISEGRSTRARSGTKKMWAVIFTCLVSRAVHLESLPAMDTTAFKNALRRFFCLRGTCRKLRSDNGTNFTGVRNQDIALSISDIEDEVKRNMCEWTLNPPNASHFGGVWERKIGTVKKIFQASVTLLGQRNLNQDEFQTFLAEAASIINSTPLYDISSDPNDPLPISPATLLHLREEGNSFPPEDFVAKDLLSYGSRRWRRVQYLSDQFWSRWRTDYVQNLQKRSKWISSKESVKKNDIVLLSDNQSKRYNWKVYRVVDVKISDDERVRSVTISNGQGKTLKRPIHKLIMLISNSPT